MDPAVSRWTETLAAAEQERKVCCVQVLSTNFGMHLTGKSIGGKGMQTAREFFVHELGDMLDAERKMLAILEQQQEEVKNQQMLKAIEVHHGQTEKQIERIEEIFQDLEENAEEQECKGVDGLRQEKEMFMQEDPSEELIEAFNIAATVKSEHYEIAAYTSLIDLAEKMEERKIVRLLNQSLREEQQMLKKAEGFSKKFKPSVMDMEEEVEEEEEVTTTRSRPRGRRAA
ncbi:MAG TPA: DUF892 family protein [Terriglobales bacterium]|nr:DUF892 family protein [Terriglobales bacterium]